MKKIKSLKNLTDGELKDIQLWAELEKSEYQKLLKKVNKEIDRRILFSDKG